MPEHQTQQPKITDNASQKQIVPIIQTLISSTASIIQRARINPKSLTPTDVLQLQRTIGNRAVGRLLSEIRNSSLVQQMPIQRQKLEEEEICPSCVQRQETLDEEESLQGVFKSKPEQASCPSCVQMKELEEEEPLQPKRENNTGMPDNLKAGVENLSGIDMSDVRVHYNSSKPTEVGALAYTQGTNIHVAPGQERHLPHEAWHVVQQAQGRVRPTVQLKESMPVNDDEGLEREADLMGKRALGENTSNKKSGSRCWQELIINKFIDVKQQEGGSVQSLLGSPIQMKQPYEIAAENLAKFAAVNLIDHASTGTGHQAAMLTLINNLATFKYKGKVHLTYYRWKSKWWCSKFQVKLGSAKDALEKHTQPWTVTYNELDITCHPLGEGPPKYSGIKKDYEAAVNDNLKNESDFWEKIWGDNSKGCERAELKSPDKYPNKKYLKGNTEFDKFKKDIENWKRDWSIGEMSGNFGEALVNAPQVTAQANPKVPNTLTIFAALDSDTLDKSLVSMIKKMTGEDDPWTIILQPFLWANKQHANPQVIQGEKEIADIQQSMNPKKLVPVYPKQIVDPDNIDDFVETNDPTAANKEVVKSVIKQAKNQSINLISAYYTQASAQDVPYDKLLKILISALQHRDIAIEKPTVIALLGDEAKTAHEEAFNALNASGKAGNLVKGTGDAAIFSDLNNLRNKIVLVSVTK